MGKERMVAWVEVAALAYYVVDGRKVLTVALLLGVETAIFALSALIFNSSLCHQKIGFSCCCICLLLAMGDHY